MNTRPTHRKKAEQRHLVLSAGLLLAVVFGMISPLLSQVVSEHYLKGVFLYNFIRLTDWPDLQHEPAGTFDICAMAQSDVVDDLRSATVGKFIGTRRIVVRKSRDVRSLNGCRVLFIDDEGLLTDSDIKAIQWGIMTVGETGDFLKRGGMIRFVTVGGHLSFEVNAGVAQQRGLKLSSRLLSVARRVE